MMDSSHIRRVAIFRNDLLAPSETFIHSQATALGRWKPVLLGRRRIDGGLPLGDIDVRLSPPARGALARWPERLGFRLERPIPRLALALRGLDVDLVHAHFGTDATDIWPSVKSVGLPMLVTLHGYDINIHREWWEAGHGGGHRRDYPRRLLKMAGDPSIAFIAVSNAIKQRAVGYGIPAEKITIAYVGVDTCRFRPGQVPLARRSRRILFVGRMVEKKAPLLMVRAFSEVRKGMPDAELVMVGDGPLLGEARRFAEALNLPVSFRGSCTSDEVLAELHQARVFCLPSITAANGDAEGLPISILEAQACGVPVVTSATGGVSEGLIDGETGGVFQNGSTTGLASELRQWLDEGRATPGVSRAASNFAADRFGLGKCSGLLEEIYDEVSGNPPAGRRGDAFSSADPLTSNMAP